MTTPALSVYPVTGLPEIEPGASALYRNVHEGGDYVILSEWKVEEAFQGFLRSEKFARVTQWGKENILRARPSHTLYRTQQ